MWRGRGIVLPNQPHVQQEGSYTIDMLETILLIHYPPIAKAAHFSMAPLQVDKLDRFCCISSGWEYAYIKAYVIK